MEQRERGDRVLMWALAGMIVLTILSMIGTVTVALIEALDYDNPDTVYCKEIDK